MSLGNEKPRRTSVGKPKNPALMETYAINRAVNTVKNDTEECIEPAP